MLKIRPGPHRKSGRSLKRVEFGSPEGRKGLTEEERGPEIGNEDAGLASEIMQDAVVRPSGQVQSGGGPGKHKQETGKSVKAQMHIVLSVAVLPKVCVCPARQIY